MRLNSFGKNGISPACGKRSVSLGTDQKKDHAARSGASIRQATPSTEANSGAFIA